MYLLSEGCVPVRWCVQFGMIAALERMIENVLG